jgi:hypothetical protein
MVDGTWIPIVAIISAPVFAIGLPLARAYARRIERGPPALALPNDVTARLERMEQAIEAVAIEVERISEGQRFTTKLLAERSVSAPPAPAGLPYIDTPR